MKSRTFLCVAALLVAFESSSKAAILLSDAFSYADGNLSGQGGWTATATAATPMQVAGGQVVLGTSGQDEHKAFTSGALALVAGEAIFSGLDVTVTAAQASGDYFFHLSNPAGTTTSFFQRFFARASGSGFQFGLVDTYGTDELTLGVKYRVLIVWNFVGAGTNNDTFSVCVNPTGPVQANNTAYLTHTWTSISVNEPAALAAANLRQGTAANAANVTVDNLVIATTFAEAIPEPSTAAALLLGAGIAPACRRRS